MTTPEPLDLTDVDGDRIRFAVNPGHTDWPIEIATAEDIDGDEDWNTRVALTHDQLAEIVKWTATIPEVGWRLHQMMRGRPYTDEELAHTPSTRRDQFLTEHLAKGRVSTPRVPLLLDPDGLQADIYGLGDPDQRQP